VAASAAGYRCTIPTKKTLVLGRSDTSCADHNVAWKTRDALKLDYVPGGVSSTGDDNIIYQQGNGFAHPECGGLETGIVGALPTTHPISTQ